MEILLFGGLIAIEFTLMLFMLSVVRSKQAAKSAKHFLIFLISFGLWTAFNYLSNQTHLSYDAMLWLNRLLFASSIFAFVAMAFFVGAIMRIKKLPANIWVVVIGILAGILSLTDGVVNSVFVEGKTVAIEFGALAILYFMAVVGLAIISLRRLLISTNSRDVKVRSYSRILLWSLGGAIAVALATNMIAPFLFNNFELSILGPYVVVLILGGVSYVIVRYSFLNIKQAAVRSVAYMLVLGVMVAMYFGLAYVASFVMGGTSVIDASSTSLNIAIALTLAFTFQPIKRFFDKVTDQIFFRDEYNVEEFYTSHNRALTSTADLRRLLERSSEEINKAIKVDQVSFFIHYADGRFVTAGTDNYNRIARKDVETLDEYVKEIRENIIAADLLADNPMIRRLMASYRLALLIPLVHDDEVLGYICLGDKKSGAYTKKDIQALMTITDGLIIAIQNALSVREIKELNETLQQRITFATRELRLSNAQLMRLDEAKDEFVSMASHQLRTPLTSIKGYISMLLEGDAGKLSNMQKHFLKEAFTSSERMVRLVNDFLNVSRLQTGRFVIDKKPTDLARVVKGELDSLKSSAESRDLEFIFKTPKDVPILGVDEDKIRQVIMNFVDNAIFYSPEGSKIHVSLTANTKEVRFEVKDQGIGVPKNEQSRLFTKFYRASNAQTQRPDGTGVGLFLAKKVISDHGGKVTFESAEGKGSTFGFVLPIAKLLVSSDSK